MGTSASFARKALHCLAAALLAFTLVPTSALAQEEAEQPQDAVDSQAGELHEVESEQVDEGPGSTPAASPAEGGTLASALVRTPTTFINSDVALDGEPIIGSFTVDGMTFAVTEGSGVELVGVSPDWQQVTSSQEGDGSPVAPMLTSGPDGPDADSLALAIPESISYEGTDYAVTSIGAYAFYLSGVSAVELPASVGNVDERAFRSSDVSSVAAADGNPIYSSFDGALYSADRSSLLLIPEGKQGTVLLPKRAEVADAGKFSHCSLASAISVEEGSAAFASENGLLYDASLTTLLRVPAGATDIVIREGCTTIAAGAMEGCAQLEHITAPASVTSISPDVFTSVPTISLPAASAVADDPGASTGATDGSSEQASSIPVSDGASTQITAMVALSSTDDDLPEVNSSDLTVLLPEGATELPWTRIGMNIMKESDGASIDGAASYSVDYPLFWIGTDATWTFRHRTGSQGIRNPGMGVWEGACRQIIYSGQSVRTQSVSSAAYYYDLGIGSYNTGISKCEYSYSVEGPYFNVPAGGSVTLDSRDAYVWLNGARSPFRVTWDAGMDGGEILDPSGQAVSKYSQYLPPMSATAFTQAVAACPSPINRPGYAFLGWSSDSVLNETSSFAQSGQEVNVEGTITYYAHWERVEYDLGFDVDSEPGDEDYPGVEKPDETVNVESGPTVIEDPKRPGYVFQGWTIPNAEGTEAIDQDLVYQDETDGKWYVDASKLPDYANDEGRVELTARWTSVISVDVPSAVTFYADVVTEGQESREGAASSAFGQNKVASQSQVDLRIVGLESTAVATQGSTLGADSILKKASSATPSSSTQKLFSLYPTDKALTPDDLQDPDAVSTTKPSDAVDFALDDLLLERSFAADKFTIPAGDTLNLGYRLNLSETGTELDYDKLSTLDEGTSASIANISYCFAADALPSEWGEPLWIENPDQSLNPAKYLLLDDIKEAAEDLSTNGESSVYYSMYKGILDRQVMSNGNPGEGPYFQLKVEGAVGGYLDLQLIGICQDVKSDGTGNAGLTFQMRDIYASENTKSAKAGGGAFNYTYMNSTNINSGGWTSSAMRSRLRSTFWGCLPLEVQGVIVSVDKWQQLYGGASASYLQKSSGETVWLPSAYEIIGSALSGYNESEALTSVSGYTPFQYMAYQGNAESSTNVHATKVYDGSPAIWWLRSANRSYSNYFSLVNAEGNLGRNNANRINGVAPCFCL